MYFSDHIDSFTRLDSSIYSEEQETLFYLFDSTEELHKLRRNCKSEQLFWNQFWHKWEYPNLRNAFVQAYSDMADDPFYKTVHRGLVPSINSYTNFEKAVASDLYKFKKSLLSLSELEQPNIFLVASYNLQAQCLQNYYGNFLSFHHSYLQYADDNETLTQYDTIKNPLHEILDTALKNFKQRFKSISSSEIRKKMPKTEPNSSISKTPLTKEEQVAQSVAKEIKDAIEKSRNSIKSISGVNVSKKMPKARIDGYRRLMITAPSGEIIETGNSNLTFLEFVIRAGWEKVAAMNLTYDGMPIFTDTKFNGYHYEVTPGVFLNCKMNCDLKIRFINDICEALGLSYTPAMTDYLDQ